MFIAATHCPLVCLCFPSQSINVDLGADVGVRIRRYPGHDVVVVPAPEAFILQRYTIVDLSVEFLGKRAIENPAQREVEAWDIFRDVDVSRAIERIYESKSRQPHVFP